MANLSQCFLLDLIKIIKKDRRRQEEEYLKRKDTNNGLLVKLGTHLASRKVSRKLSRKVWNGPMRIQFL